MSITTFLHEVYDFVTGGSSPVAATSAYVKKTPNSAVNQKEYVGNPNEGLEVEGARKETAKLTIRPKYTPTNDIKVNDLIKICNANGIDAEKLVNGLEQVIGSNKSLTEAQKEQAVRFLYHSVERAAQHCKKAGSDIDLTTAVLHDAKRTYEFMKTHSKADIQTVKPEDMDKLASSANLDKEQSSLLSSSDKISDEEWSKSVKQYRIDRKAKYEAKKAQINSMPISAEKKAEQIAILDAQFEAADDLMSRTILLKGDNNKTVRALTIQPASMLGTNSKMVLECSKDDAERQRLSNEVITFEFYENEILSVYGKDELSSQEALKGIEGFNAEIASWRDSDNSVLFEYNLNRAKTSGKDYFTDDVIKATVIGNIIGTSTSNVLTAAQIESITKLYLHNNANILSAEDLDYIDRTVQQRVAEYNATRPDNPIKAPKSSKVMLQELEKVKNGNSTSKVATPSNNAKNFVSSVIAVKSSSKSNADIAEKQVASEQIASIQKTEQLIKKGKSIPEVCAEVGTPAVNYVLAHSSYSKKFLSDDNMIAKYNNEIKLYIKANLHKVDDKISYVINNPKVLNIMLCCLNDDEKSKFSNAIKGNISYTTYTATFKTEGQKG